MATPENHVDTNAVTVKPTSESGIAVVIEAYDEDSKADFLQCRLPDGTVIFGIDHEGKTYKGKAPKEE